MARTEIPIIVLNPTTGDFEENAEVTVAVRGGGGATVYTTATGGIEATQPLSTDAQGRVDGWLDRGAYTITISVDGHADTTEAYDSSPGANGAIDSTWIADNAVTEAKVAANAITNAKIGDNAITSVELADNAVDTDAIANDAVTNTKLGDDSVDSSILRDDASTDGNRAVTTNHIRNSAITSGKIADGAVTTAKVDAEILNRYTLIWHDSGRYEGAAIGSGSAGAFIFPGTASEVSAHPTNCFYYHPAFYSITGKTTQLALAGVAVTDHSPSSMGTTAKVGLYKRDVDSVSPGAGLGALVASSYVTIPNIASETEALLSTVQFAEPAAGAYCFGVYFDAATNSSTAIEFHMQLYVRRI